MTTTTSPPRLPRQMLSGGASVAVRLPSERGMVAHRPERDTRPAPIPGYPGRNEQIVFAACSRDDGECRELTASWADHLGAQACTEPACFPEADAR
ncbi:hypothetical protein ABT023_16360 [Micromonospora sp. NPDC002296]|uniref:hypothetical protein n=1 Tax=Micromonospora sp. NPDC002296 TaxID=3154271 RepID=UPI0033237251